MPFYFIQIVKKLVFYFQNCSDLLWEKIVLVIEKTFEIRRWRLRNCKFLISLEQIVQTVKVQHNFLTKCFFNLFLEVSQIYVKHYGFRNLHKKLENLRIVFSFFSNLIHFWFCKSNAVSVSKRTCHLGCTQTCHHSWNLVQSMRLIKMTQKKFSCK